MRFIWVLTYAVAISLIISSTALLPKEGSPVLVITSPFKENSAIGAISETDNALIVSTLLPWIAISTSEITGTSDLTTSLYKHGALLILDAKPVLYCL